MMLRWIGLALLSASWLPAVGFYHLPDTAAWLLMLTAGATLMFGAPLGVPPRPASLPALGALLLVLLTIPLWHAPHRAGAIVLAIGLAAAALPAPVGWPRRLGHGAIAAGAVLCAQAAALWFYQATTARSHELPGWLAQGLAWVLRGAGFNAAVHGSDLSLYSMRVTHSIGATWELLLDPASLCFLGGAATLIVLARGPAAALRPLGAFVALALVWLPLRAALVLALYLHQVLHTDYDDPLAAIGLFWGTLTHLVLLLPLALAAWRVTRTDPRAPAPGDAPPALPPAPRRAARAAAGCAFVAAGVALVCVGLFHNPAGARKAGRVLVDEHHSTWEPTTRPMDKTWYGHMSGYNYACLYDYASRFFEMGRITTPITPAVLAACDVLVLKVPTSPYAPAEVDAILRFVNDGGGVVLIGEHTNVFATGKHLNDVARHLGFTFRHDCCFGVDQFFEESYRPPLVPHPIIQRLTHLDFAVSCSIAPRGAGGRAVIRGQGLKNARAEYHASNFYPQAVDYPDMRAGAFVQAFATSRGKGRAVAFGDSTIFSNFSMFEPGKPQLLLGMLEWANRTEPGGPVLPAAFVATGLALAVAGAAVVLAAAPHLWTLALAIALGAHGLTALVVRRAHLAAVPEPAAVRPYTMVTIDQTVSGAVLPKSGFIGAKDDGYGIYERWVLRLGYFNRRAVGPAVTALDPPTQMVVEFIPNKHPDAAHVERLRQYVEAGGRLLVIDSARNTASTANSLLWPYKLAVRKPPAPLAGPLAGPAGWPRVPADQACEVTGPAGLIPFAKLGETVVGATLPYGKGSVCVVGFGTRFADPGMGGTGDVEPDDALKDVYEWQYRLLPALLAGEPPTLSPPTTRPGPATRAADP